MSWSVEVYTNTQQKGQIKRPKYLVILITQKLTDGNFRERP